MFDGNTSASASRRAAVQEIRTTALPNEMGWLYGYIERKLLP